MPYYDFLIDCPVNCALIYAVRCIAKHLVVVHLDLNQNLGDGFLVRILNAAFV